MRALLIQNLKQVFRSHLIYTFFTTAVCLHVAALWVAMRLKNVIAGNFQVGALLSDSHNLFVSIYVQLFCGTLLAFAFGIWLVPSLHRSERLRLIATLPVPKWKFVVTYFIVFAILILCLDAMMFATFYAVAGEFPKKAITIPFAPQSAIGANVAACLLLEFLAFETMMFAFGLGSLIIGQTSTFFLGAIGIVGMQMLGILFRFTRFKLDYEITSQGKIWLKTALETIYDKLPPFGELSFDLWQQFRKPVWPGPGLGLWAVWLLIFALLLWVHLIRRTPSATLNP